MAYQQITGDGLLWGLPWTWFNLAANAGFSSSVIDATGEMFAWLGRVWLPTRTGTKDISRVQFRFGTVTKSGGSAMTVSLQNIDLATGPPTQPDGTQDQTVAIANADAAFVSNTWYRTGAFSANRTVTHGDLLGVVIEYDGAGRLSSDVVNLSNFTWFNSSAVGYCSLKTGGTWATASVASNLLLEMSDGSFGRLDTGIPVKAFNSHAFNTGSAADEFAMAFQVPFKCKIDALGAILTIAGGTTDFELILYTGTTPTVTASVDGNTYNAVGTRTVLLPIAETELAANTQYYLAVKPTTANNVTAFSYDVDNANHLSLYPGGTSWTYTNRVDGGSWAAVTTTRQLLLGIRISSLDDGAGGGLLSPVPMSGGLV